MGGSPLGSVARSLRRLLVRAPQPIPDRYRAALLREAFAAPGCPLCRLLAEREQRLLAALLWEQVNDPVTAAELAAARGFCWEHSWALVPASAVVHSRLGVTIVLERILRDAFRAATDRAGLERWLRPLAPCPVCRWLAGSEESLLDLAARLARSDPSLAADRPGLLCVPHARQLARDVPDFPWQRWEERAARASVAWSREAAAAHEVGRPPWYLPRAAELPAVCPRCATQPIADERLRRWWSLAAPVPADGLPSECCLGHALDALDPPTWRDELAQLLDDLAAFAAAHDYRFRGTLARPARTSWLRAIVRLVGVVPAAGPHERAPRPSV
ncbi:MAG: hypothetical protein RMK01_08955 [Thermomicrobium sp.]|nr:hypothetical protein [Thermomicrobium sp.]